MGNELRDCRIFESEETKQNLWIVRIGHQQQRPGNLRWLLPRRRPGFAKWSAAPRRARLCASASGCKFPMHGGCRPNRVEIIRSNPNSSIRSPMPCNRAESKGESSVGSSMYSRAIFMVDRVPTLGTYRLWLAALSTRSRIASLTRGSLLMTRDTVATETPTREAMASLTEDIGFFRRTMCNCNCYF